MTAEQSPQSPNSPPGLFDRLFAFHAMRFGDSDVPESADIDDLAAIAEIERAISDAESRATPALRNPTAPASPFAPAPHISPAKETMILGKADLIELAVQTWRLGRRIEGLDAEKFARERRQLSDSLRRFQKLADHCRLEIVDPVGQRYVEGWVEVEVISWDPPEPDDHESVYRIKQTIAPIVRRDAEIIARGQVIVIDKFGDA